jgi:acetyl-CoA C-acetyltransferase
MLIGLKEVGETRLKPRAIIRMGAVLGSEPLMLEGPIRLLKSIANAKMNASDIDILRLMKLLQWFQCV